MDEPRVFTSADLRVGMQAEFEREITPEDVESFAALSGDRNPLHVDRAYAQRTNYEARIVHGAFQVALASAMAGMYLPGRDVVVGSFQCRFPAPLFYPSRVRVQAEVTAWFPQSVNGTLRVRVMELSHTVLTAEIHVGFSLHEKRAERPAPESRRSAGDDKALVIVTGAGGALGGHLASKLSEHYTVIGVARSHAAEPADRNIEWVGADLTGDEWEESLDRQLRCRRIYGLVHAAWPAAPQGSLLDTETEAVADQLQFGALVTIRLARFLKARADDPARLIVMGTTAATLKPVLNMSAYSLGKAALEHTVRLLAPELARKKITANVVAPSFVPVGMNGAKPSRAILSETAKVPLGRLCLPEDVAQTVEFLLSPGASFLTGQLLPLTGGQL